MGSRREERQEEEKGPTTRRDKKNRRLSLEKVPGSHNPTTECKEHMRVSIYRRKKRQGKYSIWHMKHVGNSISIVNVKPHKANLSSVLPIYRQSMSSRRRQEGNKKELFIFLPVKYMVVGSTLG